MREKIAIHHHQESNKNAHQQNDINHQTIVVIIKNNIQIIFPKL
jgi:hypothetical protein